MGQLPEAALRCPRTGLSPVPEAGRLPPPRTSSKSLQQLEPSAGQPLTCPQMPTSLGLGVVSRSHMLIIEGPTQLSPPVQNEPLAGFTTPSMAV